MKIQLFPKGGKALLNDDKGPIQITVEENGVGPIQEMQADEQLIKHHFPNLKMTDIVMPHKK